MKIPWVRRDISGRNMIVMEWIDGIPCTDLTQGPALLLRATPFSPGCPSSRLLIGGEGLWGSARRLVSHR